MRDQIMPLILEEIEPVFADETGECLGYACCDFCGQSYVMLPEGMRWYMVQPEELITCGDCVPDIEDTPPSLSPAPSPEADRLERDGHISV